MAGSVVVSVLAGSDVGVDVGVDVDADVVGTVVSDTPTGSGSPRPQAAAATRTTAITAMRRMSSPPAVARRSFGARSCECRGGNMPDRAAKPYVAVGAVGGVS